MHLQIDGGKKLKDLWTRIHVRADKALNVAFGNIAFITRWPDAHPDSVLISIPPFRFLCHLESQNLRLQHLLLHEPSLLLAADGRHFNALHLRLGLGSFLGQQLCLLLCYLGLLSQQVCCLF